MDGSCKEFQVQVHLPAEYEVLIKVVESLPGQPGSLVSPWVSFALNINVCTEAHRDVGDKGICLVLSVGNYAGGSLVMAEPGLVFELGSGDFACFPSHRFTHFNLHYEGERASFALHSDKAFDRWEEGDNGWSHNQYWG